MGGVPENPESTRPLLKKRISVSAILGLTGLTASLLMVLLYLIVSSINFNLKIHENLENEGSTIVSRLTLAVSKAFWDLDLDSTQQIISGELANPDLAQVRLTKPDGTVFLALEHSDSGVRVISPGSRRELPVQPGSWLEKSLPVNFSGIEIGKVTIRLSPEARQVGFARDMSTVVATQLIISFLVVFLILGVVQRLIIRPLVRVTRVLEQFSRQDFTAPVPEFASKEMDSMSRVMNHMAKTIDSYQTQMESLVELRTKQLLESAKFAQMGIFMTGLAHEMNTPLGNSVLAVSFLNERILAFEKECAAGPIHHASLQAFFTDLKQAGQLAYRGIERASQFINVLKTLGLDDKPHGERAIRIDNFLTELVGTFQAEAATKNIRMETQAPLGLSLRLHAAILYQVLTNLIFLALDYGFTGRGTPGSIVCAARFANGLLTVECRDDGQGMTASQLDHLFSPFGLSGDSLGKNKPRETVLRQSLGPFMLQSLLKSVQGDLAAQSEPGRGTVFTVTIPAQPVDITSV